MELTYSTDRERELNLPGPLPHGFDRVDKGDSGWASFKKCYGLQTENGPVLEQGRFVAKLVKRGSPEHHSMTLQVDYRAPGDPEHFNHVWIQLTDEAKSLLHLVDDEKLSFEVDFDSVQFKALNEEKKPAVTRSVSD